MEHGLKNIMFDVQNHIAHRAVCYNFPLAQDKPLGVPAFVRLSIAVQVSKSARNTPSDDVSQCDVPFIPIFFYLAREKINKFQQQLCTTFLYNPCSEQWHINDKNTALKPCIFQVRWLISNDLAKKQMVTVLIHYLITIMCTSFETIFTTSLPVGIFVVA